MIVGKVKNVFDFVQRLGYASIIGFFNDFSDIIKNKLTIRWNGHVDKIVSNMLKAYSRPVCGFFDSNIKHGGPDPNTHQRPDGKERRPIDRKRRQTDDDSSDGTDLLKYDKNNPIKGLNQILGNFRTWAERHINECWGQRKHNHVSNRMQRWIRNALLII